MWIIFPLSWLAIAACVVFFVLSVLGVQVANAFLTLQSGLLWLILIAILLINVVFVMGLSPEKVRKASDQCIHKAGAGRLKALANWATSAVTCAGSIIADLYLFIPFIAFVVCYIADYAREAASDPIWMVLGFVDIILFVLVIFIVGCLVLMFWFFEAWVLAGAMEKGWFLGLMAALAKIIVGICVASVMSRFLPPEGNQIYIDIIKGSFYEPIVASVPNLFFN